jgi:hypothetical protein
MCREQERAPRQFAPQQLPQQHFAHGVNACGGLVEEHDRGALTERKKDKKSMPWYI